MTAHFLLSFDGIDDTQRGQIQALVEKLAEDWWHQQLNVWIVRGGGRDSKEWRDRLAPLVHAAPATVLVISLGPRLSWAVKAPAGAQRLGTPWLKEAFPSFTHREIGAADRPRTEEAT